jgi:hypothetical protein
MGEPGHSGRANVWLAQVGSDPRQRAREIANAYSTFRSTHALDGQRLRDVVAASWLRSSDASIEPQAAPPVVLADRDLEHYRSNHPLARVIDVLRQLVGAAADDGDHLMAVSDAAGRLLWVEGHRGIRTKAERMNFVEGAWWDEAHAGTNAPGTALAVDHEVQIFATEHFLPKVQAWTCSAAPIHDPATGELLGVVDITGGDGVASPLSLGLVRAAARAAEAELARPGGLWVPRQAAPGPPTRHLAALGRTDGLLRLPGRTIKLHRRHTEVMVLLALHPDGLTGEQLAAMLFDDAGNPGNAVNPVTLRVEMTRLRHVIGELLGSRPYRIRHRVATDFGEVAEALRVGDVAGALARYPGPLLPSSQAPGIVEQRRWLETRMRAGVLAAADPELVRRWADGCGFDDLQVWERLAAIARPRSAHRVIAATRIQQLAAEYGLVPE